ncbi:MAG: ferrous iron transport protein A [Ichthyobacteriaceae bacterium]|nr:ferrous iron transport protein A [Ichthyobacteriaceae bacterium]
MDKTVADLKPGEVGVIKGFSNDKDVIKLLEMGCLPDSELSVKYAAPFKGPFFINVAGSDLVIRRCVAKSILLK